MATERGFRVGQPLMDTTKSNEKVVPDTETLSVVMGTHPLSSKQFPKKIQETKCTFIELCVCVSPRVGEWQSSLQAAGLSSISAASVSQP